MRKVAFLPLLFMALISGSCSKKDEGALEISVSPQQTFVIPAATFSCKQIIDGVTDSPEISKSYVKYTKITFNWSGQNPLTLVYVKLTLTGSGLAETSCVLADEDLVALLNAGGTSTISPIIAAGSTETPTQVVSPCAIKCGGLSFSSGNPSFISGNVRVFGVETKADGEEIPIFAETSVTAQFEGE